MPTTTAQPNQLPRKVADAAEGISVREAVETWFAGFTENSRRAYLFDLMTFARWLGIETHDKPNVIETALRSRVRDILHVESFLQNVF